MGAPEAANAITLARRRSIDFCALQVAFDGRVFLLREDRRRDYGETRYNMIVEINGVVLNLMFTPRPVHAKFDQDVVDWFKAQGRGYQARMNAVLRRYMDAQRKVG